MHRTKPLSGGRRAEAIARSRALAAQGDLDAAVRVCLEADAFETAAEIRLKQDRPGDAARLYLLGLGSGVGDLTRLDAPYREQAALAARCFIAAGETRFAADIYRALGEEDKLRGLGAEARSKPAVPGSLPLIREVARLAEDLDRPAEVARILEAGGVYGEAALAYLAAGDRASSLAVLTRILPADPQYRQACVRAVALAVESDELSVVLEQFLSRFVHTGPMSAIELDAFYGLAMLYEKHRFLGNAEEALRKLLAIRGDYQNAAEALARVEAERRRNTTSAASILAEEAAFLGGARRERARAASSSASTGTPGALTAPASVPPSVPQVGPFVEGATVARRYRIGKVLGRGGMSLVFEAQDEELGQPVALKVFVHPVQDDELGARFKREMQVSRQLLHPNILRLHDLDAYQGYRFVSMERLRGSDLRQKISQQPPLDQALEFLVQVCLGLQAAHDFGVVHRDIKPENLFWTDEGRAKIMDFGIAKVMSAPHITLGGVIWGTPRYMSPEQINDFSSVSTASDLYSLGVVAYELLVGHPPFDHTDFTQLLMMHLRQLPLPPRELRPEIPAEIEALLLSMLAKTPGERPASAQECANRLRVAAIDLTR